MYWMIMVPMMNYAGLSPEYVDIPEGATALSAGYTPYNILRPEAVESIFMLWRITKDPQYLDWGWDIFEAFEKWSKVRLDLPSQVMIQRTGAGS
jgi:hypothetical protein